MRIDFLPDALIFDVDGVLLDVRNSFPEVIRQGILMGWTAICGGIADSTGYTEEHEKIFKRHGSFNDDYDIAWTMLSIAASRGKERLSEALPSPAELSSELLSFDGTAVSWVKMRYGGLVSRDISRKICTELYIGKGGTGGLYKLETPMLDRHWNSLPLPVGIYTGRDLSEWELAKERLGWQDFPDKSIIHSDTGILKPSPKGLEVLSERLSCRAPVFFGDTASDMKAHTTFGRGYFVAVGNLLPEADYVYGETGKAVEEILSLLKGDGNG